MKYLIGFIGGFIVGVVFWGFVVLYVNPADVKGCHDAVKSAGLPYCNGVAKDPV